MSFAITDNAAYELHQNEVVRLKRAAVLDPGSAFMPFDPEYKSLAAFEQVGGDDHYLFSGTFDQITADVLDMLAARISLDNRLKGFWPDGTGENDGLKLALYPETLGRNPGEILALAHSEFSESLDAVRSGGLETKDDKLPHRSGFATEIVDAIIRGLDATGGYNQSPGSILVEKLAYNRTRPYKHSRSF